jgi:hypothetical protein
MNKKTNVVLALGVISLVGGVVAGCGDSAEVGAFDAIHTANLPPPKPPAPGIACPGVGAKKDKTMSGNTPLVGVGAWSWEQAQKLCTDDIRDRLTSLVKDEQCSATSNCPLDKTGKKPPCERHVIINPPLNNDNIAFNLKGNFGSGFKGSCVWPKVENTTGTVNVSCACSNAGPKPAAFERSCAGFEGDTFIVSANTECGDCMEYDYDLDGTFDEQVWTCTPVGGCSGVGGGDPTGGAGGDATECAGDDPTGGAGGDATSGTGSDATSGGGGDAPSGTGSDATSGGGGDAPVYWSDSFSSSTGPG